MAKVLWIVFFILGQSFGMEGKKDYALSPQVNKFGNFIVFDNYGDSPSQKTVQTNYPSLDQILNTHPSAPPLTEEEYKNQIYVPPYNPYNPPNSCNPSNPECQFQYQQQLQQLPPQESKLVRRIQHAPQQESKLVRRKQVQEELPTTCHLEKTVTENSEKLTLISANIEHLKEMMEANTQSNQAILPHIDRREMLRAENKFLYDTLNFLGTGVRGITSVCIGYCTYSWVSTAVVVVSPVLTISPLWPVALGIGSAAWSYLWGR